MSVLRPPAAQARRLRRVLGELARRPASRLTNRVRPLVPAGLRRPLLSVVIPVYNVETWLPACLDSALGCTLRDVEVIVVDDGSTDRCPEIISQYARMDPRIKPLAQTNAGQGMARNLGVAHATGHFLTFLDADDVVPPDAYRYLVDVLSRSGSDFVVGPAMLLKRHGRLSPPSWNRSVFLRDRIGITIDDFPAAMLDVLACNRVFRRNFWTERVGGYRGGVVYEDHVPMVAAYLRAARFDIVARVIYHWRVRADRTSTRQQKHSINNLRDRIEVKAEAFELLTAEASDDVRAAWLGRVLDLDLAAFIDSALFADQEYRSLLQQEFARYLPAPTDQAWRHVRVQQKIRGYLAASGRWDALQAMQDYVRDGGAPLPTVVRDGNILAAEPVGAAIGVKLPEHVRTLGEHETDLRICLRQVVWSDQDTLTLLGWSVIKNLDFGDRLPHTEAWLLEQATGRRIEVPVSQFSTPEATRWSRQRHANCDTSGFRAMVPIGPLLQPGGAEPTWQLWLRVSLDGVVRAGTAHDYVPGSSAAPKALSARVVQAGGTRVQPRFDPTNGFVLATHRCVVAAAGLDVPSEGQLLTGQLRTAGRRFRPHRIHLVGPNRRLSVTGALTATKGGGFGFALRLPAGASAPGSPALRWQVRVSDDSGRTHPLEWPPQLADATLNSVTGDLAWRRSDKGYVQLVRGLPLIGAIAVAGTEQAAELCVAGPAAELTGLSAINLDTIPPVVSGSGEASGTARQWWRFVLRATQADGIERPLSSGTYWVDYRDRNGPLHRLQVDPALLAALPTEVLTADHRVRFAASGGNLQVGLKPPLADDEVGEWAQARLLDWYRCLERIPEPSVLFQRGPGEPPTDTLLAVHRLLTRCRPELIVYWGVSDLSIMVPDGSVPVVVRSRRWWERLAATPYLCTDTEFSAPLRKRPFQRHLAISDEPVAPPAGRRSEGARPRDRWDCLVVPDAASAGAVAEWAGETPAIVLTGEPWLDRLVHPDRDLIRTRMRAMLRLDPQQVVVLVIVTRHEHGDDHRTGSPGPDLHRLADLLGERYVVLHRSDRPVRRNRLRHHPRVRQVARTCELADLMLAADAVLLDQPGMGSAVAVAGRPMVFFSPPGWSAADPADASRPGPAVPTVEAAADAFGDLALLAERYASQIAALAAAHRQIYDGHATERVVAGLLGEPQHSASRLAAGPDSAH